MGRISLINERVTLYGTFIQSPAKLEVICRAVRVLVALFGGGGGTWMRVQVRGFKIAGSRTRSVLKTIR